MPRNRRTPGRPGPGPSPRIRVPDRNKTRAISSAALRAIRPPRRRRARRPAARARCSSGSSKRWSGRRGKEPLLRDEQHVVPRAGQVLGQRQVEVRAQAQGEDCAVAHHLQAGAQVADGLAQVAGQQPEDPAEDRRRRRPAHPTPGPARGEPARPGRRARRPPRTRRSLPGRASGWRSPRPGSRVQRPARERSTFSPSPSRV